MKKPHVLNRPMFNRGGTSAYGRGITSNLVSDEQRQRFNYGGRVKLSYGTPWNPDRMPSGAEDYVANHPLSHTAAYSGWKPWELPMDQRRRTSPIRTPVTYEVEDDLLSEEGDIIAGGDKEYYDVFPSLFKGRRDIAAATEDDEGPYGTNRERQLGVMDLEDPLEYQGDVIKKAEVIDTKDRGDVMTDSDWMELLGPTPEQKKRTKGEAQLGLAAGALDVFSQPTVAKGMRAASPHLSKLAQTASADQKAREKAILQGKVLEKVYKGREESKGEQARKTLETKTDIISASENPRTRYYAGLDAKIGMKKAMEEALGYPIQTIKKDKKTNAPVIPEGTTEETVMWDSESGFMILKDGNLVPVTETQIFGIAT